MQQKHKRNIDKNIKIISNNDIPNHILEEKVNEFQSPVEYIGKVNLPKFSGTRIMMLPFLLEDPKSISPDQLSPELIETVYNLINLSPVKDGTGYVTIDEAEIEPNNTHRRPGLHVDGIGPDGRKGVWSSGDGGVWSKEGMLLVASHTGCKAWKQTFKGFPKANGDCNHLADQCKKENEIIMAPNKVYMLGALSVHDSIPPSRTERVERQLIRISLPNNAPWYEGYTKNILGIMPTGPIHQPRTNFMNYRPS